MSTSGRRTARAELLAAGFQDADTAAGRLERLGDAAGAVLPVLAGVADPDLALAGLTDLQEQVDDPAALHDVLAGDEGTTRRLLAVLGSSRALGEHLRIHPEHWRELADETLERTRPAAWAVREGLLRAVGADPAAPAPRATEEDAASLRALRVEYRRVLLRLMARDLAHDVRVDDVAAELAELADGTLEAALAVARGRVGEEADHVRLGVVALGKCGGHELNYVSDVDVLFVHAPADGADEQEATRLAGRLAAGLMQVCSEQTSEGAIWTVDANLRPEGRSGPLSRTLASHEGYYTKWAKTWEFQAMLKARPVAGDRALGRAFCDLVTPLVWSAAEREGFVTDVQAMRRRVLEHLPAGDQERELKLGQGGLRDVEFAVQLLQLVHGRGDEQIRPGATLSALAELTRGGYVGREDGDALQAAYAFLRRLEHRVQLYDLRRTHVVPEDPATKRRLGRALGFVKRPQEGLDEAWRHHRREVRRLHEKLFYRPLLAAVARIPSEEVRLTPAAAQQRLAALGYADPSAALRHLQALTAGVSRTASIQQTLLPVMLEWFADAPDPDAGLLGFRRISESLGATHWYLRLLRDEGQVAERLARLLGTTRYATDLLEREPQGVRILADDLTPASAEALTGEMTAAAQRQPTLADAVQVIRGVRRRELFRTACADLFGVAEVGEIGAALSRLTTATLEATLATVRHAVARERGWSEPPARIAVVAMGRYGGFELSYASDADVMFVHEPAAGADPEEASAYARAVVTELRTQLGAPGPDPALAVDPDLRPEGKQGALTRTLESYRTYYATWSHVWEFQALLRADAVVGDPELCEQFTTLIDPVRFPPDGLGEDDVVEIRRIKARVDDERLPRGADPTTHLKLGRGGLTDIEWTVQLWQMQHAGRVPALRTPHTLEALAAIGEAGLLDAEDVETLTAAWRQVSRVRNAATLVRGRTVDHLPSDPRERRAVADVLGYEPGDSDAMVNDYRRITRHARNVVERVFWE